VRGITFDDIETIHTSMKATPYRANRVLALLSKMFSLASTRWQKWTGLENNPARGIRRYPEESRQRYLSPDELGLLAKVLSEHRDQRSANAVRLLILTGARKTEVLRASWQQIDLERGTWTKPAHFTKQNREHRLPLSAAALKLLQEMKENASSDFLFPGETPDQPMGDLKKFWRNVCRAADLAGVRLHDLRHSHASILASAGISLPMIGALLGHTQVTTTKRYSHLFDDPLRAAADRVGNLFDAVSNGNQGDVVDLKKRA
jgi:integrase